MFTAIKESYVTKFDSPITAYMWYRMNEGMTPDEEASDEECGVARFGKRIIDWDEQGFVSNSRYQTEEECLFDYERLAAMINGAVIVKICSDCLYQSEYGTTDDHSNITLEWPNISDDQIVVASGYDTEPTFSWHYCYLCQRENNAGDRYTAFIYSR